MMRTSTLYARLKALDIPCREIVSMSNYTTMQVGGIAPVVAFVRNAEEMVTAVREAKNNGVKYAVIGNGSNTLFADDGYDGLVIVTTDMKKHSVEGNIIKADCGASLTRLAVAAQRASLTGLEFAYGIPGTVGGGVYMNAGAFGGSLSDVVVSSICYDAKNDVIRKFDREEHAFRYRESVYTHNPEYIILAIMLELKTGKMEEIVEKMNTNIRSRKEKQPLEYPSAGSVFKRPVGFYAGELIEQCGLKGYRIGGAEVSEKHAGFIINRGGATAEDVMRLIGHIKTKVFLEHSVELECEVEYFS
ncbi:MAG: UDP-N-acetylmuramate dehydrogenase [Ruminococcaceae bacterium]|nr:UDP-N-acetylmuramate dehydrogenase [Oscillospiraceae bacterium]